MRKTSVRYGLNLIITAVILVIITTFFHAHVAALVNLSYPEENRLVFLGLFWGGIVGCAGILVTVIGILGSAARGRDVALLPTLIILAGAVLLFFFLLFSSFSSPGPGRLRPGETITI